MSELGVRIIDVENPETGKITTVEVSRACTVRGAIQAMGCDPGAVSLVRNGQALDLDDDFQPEFWQDNLFSDGGAESSPFRLSYLDD